MVLSIGPHDGTVEERETAAYADRCLPFRLHFKNVDDRMGLDPRSLSMGFSVIFIVVAVFLLGKQAGSWRQFKLGQSYWWMLMILLGLFSTEGYFIPVGAIVYLCFRTASRTRSRDPGD